LHNKATLSVQYHTKTRAKVKHYFITSRGGKLIWLGGNFEKAAFTGGPYFVWK